MIQKSDNGGSPSKNGAAPDKAGEPAPLSYFYGWFVGVAAIRTLFGISGLIADIAFSHSTAFASLALMCAPISASASSQLTRRKPGSASET